MARIAKDGLRWRALDAYGLAVLLCLALVPAALAQGGIVHLSGEQTATQSLTLIRPSDPTFEGMIDSYYPGLSDEAGYQKSVRPFLVVVRNDTPLLAMAYAVTWTVHYANGQAGFRRAMFINRPLMNPGRMTFLRPGEIRLIGPMFNLTPKDYEQYKSFAQFYPANVYPRSQELASVDVVVDGVVYSDGTFIGADKTRILQRYLMARTAVRDETLAALKLIQSYPAPPALYAVQPLLQSLNRQFQWELQANQNTLLGMYVRARGRVAADLEDILRSRGFSGLEAVLRDGVAGAAGNTNPSMFGEEYQNLSDDDPRVFGSIPYRHGSH